MIFFNNQLMKSQDQLRLYLVSNPTPFKRFEDHEAAIQLQLYELIEQAIADKENPIGLIEDNLKITYMEGESVEEIANFLVNTDQMLHAMHNLKDNWHHMDESVPSDSLLYGSGITRETAVSIYADTTLRNYLETLARVYGEG
jgi:hypothetical protein